MVAALTLLMIALALFSATARAEVRSGTAAQLVRAVDLKKRPEDGAGGLGRLPRGTIVSLSGEVRNGFVAVDVELEEGSISGWVPRSALNRQARELLPSDVRSDKEEDEEEEVKPRRRSDEPAEDDEPVIVRPRSRIKVPKDEGLLMRRDPSFFYGVHLGGGQAILQSPDVTDENFLGPTLRGGAQLGFHLFRNVTLQIEVAYVSLTGTEANGQYLSFGFLDSGALFSYMIDDFEINAGASFAYGIAVGDLPEKILNNAAGDFSTLLFGGGLGYRFHLGEVTDLVLRARYNISLMRAPLFSQTFNLIAFVEFRG